MSVVAKVMMGGACKEIKLSIAKKRINLDGYGKGNW